MSRAWRMLARLVEGIGGALAVAAAWCLEVAFRLDDRAHGRTVYIAPDCGRRGK